MANTVFQHKRSGTPANVPSSLELGELAINYADGLIFYKNTTGHIVSISGGGGGNSFGTINANGTIVVADTPGDVLSLVAGNNVTFSVDAVNDIITINSSGGDIAIQINSATEIAFDDADHLVARRASDGAIIKRTWANVKNDLPSVFPVLTRTGNTVNITIGNGLITILTRSGATVNVAVN